MRLRLTAGFAIVAVATGAWLSVPVLAQRGGQGRGGAPPAAAQQQQQQQQQQQESQAVMQYVQDVIAGVAVPPDATLTWQPYFVKSQGNQLYVPFTVVLEPGKLSAKQVAMYYSVVPKGPQVTTFAVKPQEEENLVSVEGEILNTAASPAESVKVSVTPMDAAGKVLGTQSGTVPSVPPGQKAAFKIPLKTPRNTSRYNVVIEGAPPGFRDLAFLDLPAATQGQPVRISRAFAVPAGEYDIYVAIRERPERDQKTVAKIALLKESVSIPDMTSQFTTSSIFLTDKIETLTAPLSREEQLKQPFALGTMAIAPSVSTMFPKTGELSIIFFVYNVGIDASKKPNVEVEYNFHQKTSDGEKFFNKTNPQQFNAQTLPPQFDLAQGHQLVGGQSVPLASFQPGDYRLEVKVIDRTSGQSLTRNVPFSVSAS